VLEITTPVTTALIGATTLATTTLTEKTKPATNYTTGNNNTD
jgi:hypothetical protein